MKEVVVTRDDEEGSSFGNSPKAKKVLEDEL